MSSTDADTDTLLLACAKGDRQAEATLFSRHRERLKRLIALRLDRQVAARVDASDIVQETLIVAAQRLNNFLEDRPLPFYPWLRQMAIEQVLKQHRYHLYAMKRTVTREVFFSDHLPDASNADWSVLLLHDVGLERSATQRDVRESIQLALEQLKSEDRDILVLRCLEELTADEAATVLGITSEAAKSRLRRALERFGKVFSKVLGD